MPESNGSGRLDRIEAILEKVGQRLDELADRQREFHASLEKMKDSLEKVRTMGYLHDERLVHVEALHEENEERWKAWLDERKQAEQAWREEQRQRELGLDTRIGRLVSAIGELIARLPPIEQPR
ncbi:MAG: hypothetical protein JO270_25355 [Acidobacteriaceae bacterium]|nr:hypothetical protein [Acidobacteriaceae bacterium]MBV8570472.1 hypothetical protein [Acidobacteriaceae bacterium]